MTIGSCKQVFLAAPPSVKGPKMVDLARITVSRGTDYKTPGPGKQHSGTHVKRQEFKSRNGDVCSLNLFGASVDTKLFLQVFACAT